MATGGEKKTQQFQAPFKEIICPRAHPRAKEHGRLGEFPHRRLSVALVLRPHLVVPEVAGRGLPGELLDAGHVDRRHGPGASASL